MRRSSMLRHVWQVSNGDGNGKKSEVEESRRAAAQVANQHRVVLVETNAIRRPKWERVNVFESLAC